MENKTAVITGGNSGIGLATAILFAKEGAKTVIIGRDPDSLKKAERIIGYGALGIASDVSNPASIKSAFETIGKEAGSIDVLIVNAGVAPSAPFADFSEELFDRISDTNFKGAFFTVQLALPYLRDGSSVILTSSATNEKGFPGNAAYAATKAAVRSLARSLSTELMDRRIRVNVISPGAIDTPLYGRGGESDEAVAGMKGYMADNMIPAKRLGTSEEVAEAFLFLASEASSYMVGSELVMDGGVKTL